MFLLNHWLVNLINFEKKFTYVIAYGEYSNMERRSIDQRKKS
jgi:hypothetical protein